MNTSNTLDTLQDLQQQRTVALDAMRTAGSDMDVFNAASRQEAQLAAQIRRLNRSGVPS